MTSGSPHAWALRVEKTKSLRFFYTSVQLSDLTPSADWHFGGYGMWDHGVMTDQGF